MRVFGDVLQLAADCVVVCADLQVVVRVHFEEVVPAGVVQGVAEFRTETWSNQLSNVGITVVAQQFLEGVFAVAWEVLVVLDFAIEVGADLLHVFLVAAGSRCEIEAEGRRVDFGDFLKSVF